MPVAGLFGCDVAVTRSRASGSTGQRIGVILLLLAAVLWSLNGVFIKTLYASGLNGWVIAAFRSLFAALFLTPFAIPRLKKIRDPGWVAAALPAFTCMCATFVIATTQTSAANAIALQYTAPVWVFLFAPLVVGDRAGERHYVSLVCSLVGVAVIFLSQYRPGYTGLLIALASGLVFGVQTVFFRRVRAVDPLVMAWLACTTSGVLLLGAASVVTSIDLTPHQVVWLVLMGIVQFAIPYVLYSAGLRNVSAQKAVLLILLELILNPVWVWLFVGEIPHWGTLVGGALILGGVLCVALPRATPSVQVDVV